MTSTPTFTIKQVSLLFTTMHKYLVDIMTAIHPRIREANSALYRNRTQHRWCSKICEV